MSRAGRREDRQPQAIALGFPRVVSDPLSRPVDAVAAKTGLTRDAVAILFIVAGVIVLIWPDFVQVVLGLVLIVVGVVWLVTSWQARQVQPPGP